MENFSQGYAIRRIQLKKTQEYISYTPDHVSVWNVHGFRFINMATSKWLANPEINSDRIAPSF